MRRLSWPHMLAHVLYLAAGVVALFIAAVCVINPLLWPVSLIALVVGVFWLGAARRLDTGGGATRVGRAFAAGTAMLALVAWWLVIAEPSDTRATSAFTSSTNGQWLAAIALMALSVLVYVSLERSAEE